MATQETLVSPDVGEPPPRWEFTNEGMAHDGLLAVPGLWVGRDGPDRLILTTAEGRSALTVPYDVAEGFLSFESWFLGALDERDISYAANLPAYEQLARDVEELFLANNEATRSIIDAAGFDVGSHDLAALLVAMAGYMYLDDADVILAALASSVSAAIQNGEPLWLMLVGPSSGGKGETLRVIDGSVHKRLKDVTLAGLLTRTQGKNSRTVGLLTEVQDQNVALTITDFSSLLGADTRSGAARGELFNAMRDIYDGHYMRTMNGGTAEWRGRLTLMGACTPAIDRFNAHSDSLGTRWVYFRLRERDAETRKLVARTALSRTQLEARRAESQRLATQIVERARARVDRVDLPRWIEELIVDGALLVGWGRANVPRDYRLDVVDVVDSEDPGRVTHQLALLARSLLALGVREDVAARIVKRTALGSIPAGRAAVLQVLAEAPEPLSTYAVAKRSGLDYKVAHRALEDWSLVGGVVESMRDEAVVDPKASWRWSVADEHRALVGRIAGQTSALL